MAAAPDSQLCPDMPADYFQTLPDEVFVLVLSLLSFGEKVGVRLVCRKWKQAVDWMFGQQSSVRIVLRPDRILMEKCGWKSEQMCDHTFDPGYDFCFAHLAYVCSGLNIPEQWSNDSKRAVDRFIGGIHFVMKYFHEVSVIASVCGYMETYMGKRAVVYCEEDRIRLQAACGELAARFASQAKCMTIPMLDINHNHSYRELVHLTCENISSDITNVFETVAPKLTALSCTQMHIANYWSLPHGFTSIRTRFLPDGELHMDSLKLILQSKGRESIRSIRVETGQRSGGRRDNFFPHLTSLTLVAASGLPMYDKFPDCLTSKRLQRLALNCNGPRFMDDNGWIEGQSIDFDCLQSLVFNNSFNSNYLIQMLKKTPQLQQLHIRLLRECLDEVALLSALSLLLHLRFVDIRFFDSWNSERPDRTAAILTFLRGPLRSNLTFCRFHYFVCRSQTPDHVQEVMAEMRVMTQTQKLVAGVVSNWIVRRDCPHADQWMELSADVLGEVLEGMI